MKIIQETQSLITTTVSTSNISVNLMSLIDNLNKYHSFDSAHIYHLTYNNISAYKHIIMESIKRYIRNIRNIGPEDKHHDLIRDVNEYFTVVVEPLLPISMILFEHEYLSINESFMLFFKEHGDIILINEKASTFDVPKPHYVVNSLVLNDNVYHSSVKGVCYESSNINGFVTFISFLLPFDKDALKIDIYKREKPLKKLELQVRTLHMGQYKSVNINMPKNLDVSKISNNHKFIFNTRLIYNGDIIFSEYDIVLNNPEETIALHLMPFVNNIKERYEIIDDIPVAITKEYYDHFKANIKPVIEMVLC